MEKVALIILDGWGLNPDASVSAVAAAQTPVMDALIEKFPNATLLTYGEDVGLPEGQMGNSEVGHINIGAGRIVYQELARINKAIREETLLDNEIFRNALSYARSHQKRLHLMGLVSDGGVHSHAEHLHGLCKLIQKAYSDVKVSIHAFLDGRDTDPMSGLGFIQEIETRYRNTNIDLATVIGRYYAMDRDQRWERVKKAYDLLVNGMGSPVQDFAQAIRDQYQKGITDEFMVPMINGHFSAENATIQEGDAVIFFNFRTDRPRQLTEVLTQKDMHEYDMHTLPLHFVTFTNYDQTFRNIGVIFEKENLTHTLGETISHAGRSQLRIAETEKYPHVTFFFNGGAEQPFQGEDRILVPSPKVATYDEQPEMSAPEITDGLITYVSEKSPDFICLNYANADMVGHTGDFGAAQKAVETVDGCLGRLLDILLPMSYRVLVVADHGNADVMINPDGSPNTAHTTNPVPVILAGNMIDKHRIKLSSGKLGDLAPTILHLMGISKPEAMTGDCLISEI